MCLWLWRKLDRVDSKCISMTSFLFLVNGSPLHLLSASRGLCQRDPLSPFPFTIVAKVWDVCLVRQGDWGLWEVFSLVLKRRQ